jgi:hypothetical protein
MKKLPLAVAIAALVAVLGLSGCPSLITGERLTCEPGGPRGTVSLTGGAISVDPYTIKVCQSNVPIVWTLDSQVPANYVFAPDGIVIQSNDGEFDDCLPGKNGTVGASGRAFICLDLNKKLRTAAPRSYKYTVKLRTTDQSQPPAELDPVIMND